MLINTIVVSDIDDTIKWSHILGPEVLGDGLNYHLAFASSGEFVGELTGSGTRLVAETVKPPASGVQGAL